MTADELREWRTRHGITQAALAVALGTSANTIWRWEAGRVRIPRPAQMRAALAELDRTYTQVQHGTGEGR